MIAIVTTSFAKTEKLQARAQNALSLVEAAYLLDGSESDWLAGLLAAGGDDLEHGCGRYAFTCKLGANAMEMTGYHEEQLDPGFGQVVETLNRTVPGAFFEMLARSAVLSGGFLEVAPPMLQKHFRAQGSKVGIFDAFSLFAQDGEGHAIDLTAPSRLAVHSGTRVRGVWKRVGVHLASALRLRRRFAEARAVRDAILSTEGKVTHAEDGVKDDRASREILTEAVRNMERARSKKERLDPHRALEMWHGLVAGQWSLVDHWEKGGKRYVAAYRNRPDVADPRTLSPKERLVLKYASLGTSNKEIAFALGLSVGGVASAVSGLLRKLRCKRRNDLVAFADPSHAVHLRVPFVGGDEVGVLAFAHAPKLDAMRGLSRAERSIVALVVEGQTNATIAKTRGTSRSTVANQIQMIFEKLNVGSRAELTRVVTSA